MAPASVSLRVRFMVIMGDYTLHACNLEAPLFSSARPGRAPEQAFADGTHRNRQVGGATKCRELQIASLPRAKRQAGVSRAWSVQRRPFSQNSQGRWTRPGQSAFS